MSSNIPFVDYYALLGVTMSASVANLKAAYLEKALVLHPDKNPDPDATAMFQLLNQGWEVLKDVESRTGYNIVYLQKVDPEHRFQQLTIESRHEVQKAREHANCLPKGLEGGKERELEVYRLQLVKDAETARAIYTKQRAYSAASKDRIKVANIVYQQRLKDMNAEVHSCQASITALKFQLDIIKTELVAFDAFDATDMQLEDERRLPAAAMPASLERQAKRAFSEALAQTLTAEMEHLLSQIAKAQSAFDHHHRLDCQRVARVALRDLQQLKINNAYGEKTSAFWNAIRRAAACATPGPEDVKVFGEYMRELERPVMDLVASAPPSREVVDEYAFSRIKEQDGMFSMVGVLI